jgi:hypothetical protein
MTQKRTVEPTIPPTIVQNWECRLIFGTFVAARLVPPNLK